MCDGPEAVFKIETALLLAQTSTENRQTTKLLQE
jgi:hypothetical protein